MELHQNLQLEKEQVIAINNLPNRSVPTAGILPFS
jgi:hypothetical protein